MTPRTIFMAVIALALAGATAVFVQGWLNKERAALYASLPKAAPEPDGKKVLVARKALPAGIILSAEHFTWKAWPEDGISKTFISEDDGGPAKAKALYGAVVRRETGAGEPITLDRVVKPGERGFRRR